MELRRFSKGKWRSNALCEEDHIHQGSVETTRNTSWIILAVQSMTERVSNPVVPLGTRTEGVRELGHSEDPFVVKVMRRDRTRACLRSAVRIFWIVRSQRL